MTEMENEENIKNTIQDTQMLIRNHMQHHKKISKQLHSQIKKEKKTIDLLQEKIAKLMVEKQKLEDKQQISSHVNQSDSKVETLKNKILQEVEEKKSYDDKIAEIHNDFLTIHQNFLQFYIHYDLILVSFLIIQFLYFSLIEVNVLYILLLINNHFYFLQ